MYLLSVTSRCTISVLRHRHTAVQTLLCHEARHIRQPEPVCTACGAARWDGDDGKLAARVSAVPQVHSAQIMHDVSAVAQRRKEAPDALDSQLAGLPPDVRAGFAAAAKMACHAAC